MVTADLSPRQLACLAFASQGRTSAQIELALGISARTVDQYIAEACQRLGVRNRTQAVAKAIGLGLIEGAPLWFYSPPKHGIDGKMASGESIRLASQLRSASAETHARSPLPSRE